MIIAVILGHDDEVLAEFALPGPTPTVRMARATPWLFHDDAPSTVPTITVDEYTPDRIETELWQMVDSRVVVYRKR